MYEVIINPTFHTFILGEEMTSTNTEKSEMSSPELKSKTEWLYSFPCLDKADNHLQALYANG